MEHRLASSGKHRHWHADFDPLLGPSQAEDIVELCHRHGSYRMYSEEPTFEGLGKGYPARVTTPSALRMLRVGARRRDGFPGGTDRRADLEVPRRRLPAIGR